MESAPKFLPPDEVFHTIRKRIPVMNKIYIESWFFRSFAHTGFFNVV